MQSINIGMTSATRGQDVHTPVKEIPPSLGFGSSSSPFFESPATINRTQQAVHVSPSNYGKADTRVNSSLLLPSQFPPANFSSLESSPPDVVRTYNAGLSTDHGSSPQPMRIKRVGRRGRPRKYEIKKDASPTKSDNTTHSSSFDTSKTSIGESSSYSLNVASSYPPTIQPEESQLSTKTSRSKLHKRHKNKPSKLSVYASRKTDNGVPLFSSDIFALACHNQSNIKGDEACALRKALSERSNVQRQFSTNGLGFNFSINLGGKVSIDATTQLTPAPTPDAHNKTIGNGGYFSPPVESHAKDESDSDSEFDGYTDENSHTRTPPRFSSLGSCDAATAFAKSLARSNDKGDGFMFLFPQINTPEKHGQLTSFIPCTPRTPRAAPMPFDESSLSMQMQTPPGAIFSYENYGFYSTGMTPFLGSARSTNC